LTDSLRIALLNPCFFPEVRRGSERIIRELADGLIERGHRPRLITSHEGLPRRDIEDGLPVIRHWRPFEGRFSRRWYQQYLTHVPFSYGSLARGDDALAHAFFPTDAAAAARCTERTGKPSVFSYMGLPDRPVLADRRHKLRLLEYVTRGSTEVVVLSEAAADGMRRWLGVTPTVIYPGVDLEVFSPIREERAREPTIFCAAAPDDARKRVALLASAFGLVRRERPDARLLLVRPSDPATVKRFGLDQPGIELLDPVDEPGELAPAYRRAWVSALPSYREAFGVVLIESLACGTPVVGARSGAIPEVLSDERVGLLFDGDDERELARTLLDAFDLSADSATADACVARASDFSSARTTEAHLSLYRRLLER
jgi:glycosyltransferase involved in cell wall biosynthesis